MIVWLASYPRSGNTLFRLVLHQSFGQKTYSIYNDPLLMKSGVGALMGQVHFDKANTGMYIRGKDAHFVKTHGHVENADQDTSPVIYIVRDGRDTLVSYAHYRIDIENVQRPFNEVLSDLVAYKMMWGGWSKHVHDWLTRPSSRAVAVIHYEDLVNYPFACTRIALTHIGLDHIATVNTGDISTFKDLKVHYPQFFRKGKVGSWRDEMSPEIENMFWVHHGPTMRMMGYVR